MSYTDKVEKAFANAQEISIANKIIDLMRDLRLNNDDTSSCRWIWELIQNAKDVVDNGNAVNIAINFDEQNKILSFGHDGKNFCTQNMVSLISQVSSKERSVIDEDITGKFGTGFLTTHLLSEEVIIDAYLQDDSEPMKKIYVSLDRSGETKEKVIQSIKKSFEELKASEEIDEFKVNTDGFHTKFIYKLDEKGIKVAKIGLNSLIYSIFYVFVFVEKINSIKINDYLYIERGEYIEHEGLLIYKIHITKNGEKSEREVLKYHEGKVDLAIPVFFKNDKLFVDKYSKKAPRIFCDFPLIGTEDFSFPFIINSPYFNPNDPRNGIYLTDIEDDIVNENKLLILQALEMYKKILERAAQKGWKQMYNAVYIPKVNTKNWLSINWLKENIIQKCKNHIVQAEIIDTSSGKRKSLFDIWGLEQDIYIVGDPTKNAREDVWKISEFLYPDSMVLFSEVHEWYSSLWDECRNIDILTLIKKIEGFGSLHELENSLNNINPIEWLNCLYKSIQRIDQNDELNDSKIYPNQLGVFCKKKDLYIDTGIENIYKEILEYLGDDCKEKLLDTKIILPTKTKCELYDYKTLFNDIEFLLDNEEISYQKVMAKLIVMVETERVIEQEQKEIISFLTTSFVDEEFKISYVNEINIEFMIKAKKYWCTEISNMISECETINILSKRLNLEEIDTWLWIKEFIEYLGKYNHKNLLERKTRPILPNQNGKFISEENIFLDHGDIDELFKDILFELGDDIREILLPINIYYKLPDSRVKCIEDISQEIVNYVKKNQGNTRNTDQNISKNFKKIFLWINENFVKAEEYFKEIVDNKHWLYDDETIADNMKKVEQYDDLFAKFNINNTQDLEFILRSYSDHKEESIVINNQDEITEELMLQYGISSAEEFNKAKGLSIFRENFTHISESDQAKFDFVKSILNRSKRAVFAYLNTLEEYDVSDPTEVTSTIFIIKKNSNDIAIIVRPSDYGQVILFYNSEKDVLDYESDVELWVEDGKSTPELITFGKMLKLSGINRIPLRKVC